MVRGQRYGSRSKIRFEVKNMVRDVLRSKIWFEVKDMFFSQTNRSRSKIWFEVKDTVQGRRYGSRSKIWFEVNDMVKDGLRSKKWLSA